MAFDLSNLEMDRRTILGLIGLGATSVGLSACAGPIGGGGGTGASVDAGVRDGFSQAPLQDIPPQYQGRTNVLFWAPFTGTNFEALTAQFTAFNDSQTDIYAAAESQGSYTDLNQKFTAALQSRQVPDIVCFPEHRWVQFWQAGAIAPLDPYFDDAWSLDVYMQQYVGEGQASGQTFAVPFARSTPLFYFNRDRFREAGLPEEGPTTWPEFAEMAPALLALDAGGNPLKAFAFSPSDEWYGQSHIWAWGGRFSDRTAVTVDAGPMAEWLEWHRKFIHDDGFGYMAKASMTDFTTGVSAGSHGSTASLTGAKKTAEFEIGTAFLLGYDAAGPKVPTGGSGLSIVKAESKERQDACGELFRFLAQPEQSAQWHRDTGYLPIVTAAQETSIVKDLVASDPNYGTALAQVKNAQSADTITWFEAPTTEISKSMAQVYGDNAEVSGVVSALQSTLEGLMTQNQDAIEKVLG